MRNLSSKCLLKCVMGLSLSKSTVCLVHKVYGVSKVLLILLRTVSVLSFCHQHQLLCAQIIFFFFVTLTCAALCVIVLEELINYTALKNLGLGWLIKWLQVFPKIFCTLITNLNQKLSIKFSFQEKGEYIHNRPLQPLQGRNRDSRINLTHAT